MTGSIIGTFLITFGFFGAIIFIPRWFQSVLGSSATESGYQMLPLMVGVIGSSDRLRADRRADGPLQVDDGRRHCTSAIGLYFMTGIRADTPVALVWLWMFIAGLGIGPSFAIFTTMVQSAVAPRIMGAATSSLTFFRQVGGSVGLAIAGTIFGSSFTTEVPRQLASHGVPQPIIDGFSSIGADGQANLTNVGVDLGQQILSSVPEAARPDDRAVHRADRDTIHQAFSISIAATMWVAVFAAAPRQWWWPCSSRSSSCAAERRRRAEQTPGALHIPVME